MLKLQTWNIISSHMMRIGRSVNYVKESGHESVMYRGDKALSHRVVFHDETYHVKPPTTVRSVSLLAPNKRDEKCIGYKAHSNRIILLSVQQKVKKTNSPSNKTMDEIPFEPPENKVHAF